MAAELIGIELIKIEEVTMALLGSKSALGALAYREDHARPNAGRCAV